MACNFVIANNEVVDVRTDSNKPSKLYRAALSKFEDKQQAINLVAVTKTDDFQANVVYNGEEPSLTSVLEYIGRQNGNQLPLSAQQIQDFKNSLIGLPINSVEEFRDDLTKAFYSGEIFNPTAAKLRSSGLYNEFEIQNIIGNINLQLRIKSSIEALNNTDLDEMSFENYFDVQTNPEKLNEINSFGKQVTANPYIVAKTAIDSLAAPKSEAEYYSNLSDLEYQTSISYLEAQRYVRAQELDSELNPALANNTAQLIPQTKQADTSNNIIANIQLIRSIPEAVAEQNPENIRTLLSAVEVGLASEGLDVIGIKDRGNDPTLKDFLTELEQFLLIPSIENTVSFSAAYNEFFTVDTSEVSRALRVRDKDKTYVYSETSLPEQQVYTEKSLLKVAPNTYIKVRKQPLEDLYATMFSYSTIPTIEEFKNYVQAQSAQLNSSENAEEFTLMKMYFNAPLVVEERVQPQQQTFTGNQEYLQNEFISDFYAESLKQKLTNSPQYKNFYSQFKINERGLYLVNTDTITVDTVNTWLGEIKAGIANNLKQYSLISKQLPELGQVDEDIEIFEDKRTTAVNYPLSIPKLTNENYRIDEDNIIVKNSESEFVRVGMDVYENTETKGTLTLYSKLPASDLNYNLQNVESPKTKLKLEDYTYLETLPNKWITDRKYISAQEQQKINEENFNCL